MAPPALWLYRALMYAALPAATPWLLFDHRRRGGRAGVFAHRLGLRLPDVPRGGVWIQAVSVGEVAVARPLLRELRGRHPEHPAVLTSTTATGLRFATGPQAADVILPFPIDLPGPVRRFFRTIEPRLVLLVETELWPEILFAAAHRRVPVVIVNARISDRAYRRYRRIRGLLRGLLSPVTQVLAQGDAEADRFVNLGIPPDRVTVTGNIKFDAAPPSPRQDLADRVSTLAAGRPVVVAGSTMSGEDLPVAEAVASIPAAERPFLILAPRHPERTAEAVHAAESAGLRALRRTAMTTADDRCDVLVLDTVGELAALYELGRIAFVGGSLVKTGGHNPIEPARFGVPVITGPHVRNFASIYDAFVGAGAARVVRDGTELGRVLRRWLADGDEAARAGVAGRELLIRNAGATTRTVDALEPFL